MLTFEIWYIDEQWWPCKDESKVIPSHYGLVLRHRTDCPIVDTFSTYICAWCMSFLKISWLHRQSYSEWLNSWYVRLQHDKLHRDARLHELHFLFSSKLGDHSADSFHIWQVYAGELFWICCSDISRSHDQKCVFSMRQNVRMITWKGYYQFTWNLVDTFILLKSGNL